MSVTDWNSFWNGVLTTVGVELVLLGIVMVLNAVYNMGIRDGQTNR